jgi:hypothetical protein
VPIEEEEVVLLNPYFLFNSFIFLFVKIHVIFFQTLSNLNVCTFQFHFQTQWHLFVRLLVCLWITAFCIYTFAVQSLLLGNTVGIFSRVY